MPVFFRESDYGLYLHILAEQAARQRVRFWAYCLMPNHVHLIAVPENADALSMTFRETHRKYTRYINLRERWSGHLWQDRFSSFVMDEPHALMAARYIENNPVEAGMVAQAEDYRWSSAAYHTGKISHDFLVMPEHPLRDLVRNWKDYLRDQTFKGQQMANPLLMKHLKLGTP
jgi:putative transposase